MSENHAAAVVAERSRSKHHGGSFSQHLDVLFLSI